MRSAWVKTEELSHILAALTPCNRLACEIALATGLRIGDVLQLKSEMVTRSCRFTIQEQKTGKRRRVYLPRALWDRACSMAGPIYVFSGRCNGRKHRSRQAVYKDIRRAAALFRLSEVVTPHSLRKAWAVDKLEETGSLKKVQKLMNHESEAVTMLYAMADRLEQRKRGRKTVS